MTTLNPLTAKEISLICLPADRDGRRYVKGSDYLWLDQSGKLWDGNQEALDGQWRYVRQRLPGTNGNQPAHDIPQPEIIEREDNTAESKQLAKTAEVKQVKTPANQRPGTAWKIRTLQDAYAERPPIAYIADGLFAIPSLNIMYGAPGTLKSMVLAELCVCVAGGIPWLTAPDGSGGRAVLQAPVLWIDIDNGQRRTDERFEAFARARQLSADAPLYYTTFPVPPLNAGRPESIDLLVRTIKQCQARLIVIDNLCVTAGDVDENSAAMAGVMANYRRIAEDLGVVIVLIHHQRKSNSSAARVGETLRGHSSIEASLDLALLVTREADNEILITGTKERGYGIEPFGAQFSFEHKPGTSDLAVARFWPYQKVAGLAEIRQTIQMTLEEVRESPKTKLAEIVYKQLGKHGVNKIRDEIDCLIAAGVIAVETGKGNTQMCRLAGV
jgi:hypothetical protein